LEPAIIRAAWRFQVRIFLVTNAGSGTLSVIDTNSKAVVHTVTLGLRASGLAVTGNTAYIANQMTASVTVVDLASAAVLKTFPVDPGPVALAASAAKNQLLVLAEGTGTLDVVDLTNYGIVTRINAGDTERQGQVPMPLISSISPSSASAGSTFALFVTGSGFQGIQGIEFVLAETGAGGGMMGGGPGTDIGQVDTNIKVSNIQANAAGTQISASVQVLPAAAVGARQIRLQTSNGTIIGMMTNLPFRVTK
jgi:YVTN family beta-propeller protein